MFSLFSRQPLDILLVAVIITRVLINAARKTRPDPNDATNLLEGRSVTREPSDKASNLEAGEGRLFV